jgi:hypothetical protein
MCWKHDKDWQPAAPALFFTRAEAQRWARQQFHYTLRNDLRRPPHNWRMPQPMRVKVTISRMEAARDA